MQDCELCKLGDDQYCQKCVFTYNGKDWADDDKLTYGGYSNRVVVNHQCALSVPAPASLPACTVIITEPGKQSSHHLLTCTGMHGCPH